jgi:hypothetical protein
LSIYSQLGARVRNITANPRVTLNFDGDGRGGDIVILSGTAHVDADAPAADANPDWLDQVRRADRADRNDAGLVRRALQRPAGYG